MHWFWMVLGILILLCVGIGRIRVGIHAAYDGTTATADVTVGPFRIRVAPGKKDKTDEGKAKKKAPPKAASSKKESGTGILDKLKTIPRPSLSDVHRALEALAPACKKALGRTRRSIRVDPLTVSVTVGGATNPAAAAETYGVLHMGVWTVMPPLEQLLVIPRPHIHVGIDFDAPQTKTTGECGISIRIGTLFAVGFGIGIPALRWFLRFQKETKQAQQPSTSPEQPVKQTAA